MTAESLLLQIGATIPAAFSAWLAAIVWLWLFRVRDAQLRSVAWTLAVLSPLAALLGGRAAGFVGFELIVPRGHVLLADPLTAPAFVAAWAAVAAALVARRAARDARLTSCVEGLASSAPVPDDLAEAVARAARWMGVAAPRVAVAEGGGTAFVTGVRAPVLFVPLDLWGRLDAAGRRALLLHEMAHIRRRDPLRLRALSVAVDVLWPAFPLRWTAARLRAAWETLADDEAVHGGATRSALARSLVEAIAAPAPAGVLAFGGAAAETSHRLRSLRRRPRGVVLVLQTALLAACYPWWPVSAFGGVNVHVERAEDRSRAGFVSLAIGSGGNPIAAAVGRGAVRRIEEEEAR